ncbi:MAG TPA: hypothetical protein VMG12_31780 [Polyangiaceae bacterium]|nr:hypothetical protein [Polyangiaceae bacterium]
MAASCLACAKGTEIPEQAIVFLSPSLPPGADAGADAGTVAPTELLTDEAAPVSTDADP